MNFAPPQSLVPPPVIRELCAYAMDCPRGDFVEVGVYKGGTAWHLSKIAMVQRRELHLFDTFNGVPKAMDLPMDKHRAGEFADTSEAKVRANVPTARFHTGMFPATMPEAWKAEGFQPFIAFIHCDCDQYKSIMAVCDWLFPLLVPEGLIWFDDADHIPAAKKAMDDFLSKDATGKLRERRTNLGKYYIRKPRRSARAMVD